MCVMKDIIIPASDGILNMSDEEFSLFGNLIYSSLGIKMPKTKKHMLISRLAKRVNALGCKSYGEYYSFLCSEQGKTTELKKMVDAVTTNKTDFYREADHFKILIDKVLPTLVETEKFLNKRLINIWSAGCSSGEEAYTIAMLMSDYFNNKNECFNILATDISSKVLQIGCDAIYPETVIKPIPDKMRKKYLMRGTGEKNGLYRIVPSLRDKVTFRYLNLMNSTFDVDEMMDIIFCRNVIIYFDKETQKTLFEKFYKQLVPGGYLFIGSSETLYGINSDFMPVGPTVYRKPMD